MGRRMLNRARRTSDVRSLIAIVLALGMLHGARRLDADGSGARDPDGARAFQTSGAELLWDTGTFSILGYDPATGEVGGAVQSRVFSVGNGVLWADAEAGVAATQ